MPLHIYQPIQTSAAEFIDFWSRRYRYAEAHLYDDNIGLGLTKQRILDLYRWKNNKDLSQKKLNSVIQNFIQRRNELSQFKDNLSANDILAHFADGGAIWRIFWLHCFRPDQFPIYDQHVHRAMMFIQNGKAEEIPKSDPRKINAYIGEYLPFYERFVATDGRVVDKALWTFGKFIKENNFPMTSLKHSSLKATASTTVDSNLMASNEMDTHSEENGQTAQAIVSSIE